VTHWLETLLAELLESDQLVELHVANGLLEEEPAA